VTDLWHTAEALVALYKHRRGDGKTPFTRADLLAWSENFAARPKAAQVALDHLQRIGMVRTVTAATEATAAKKPGLHRFIVTREGLVAAKAADDARLSAIRAASCTKGNKARPRGEFITRLWALFRMRKSLTGTEAAETLVDAGDDVKRAARTAAMYLRCWVAMHPEHIQISSKRVGGSFRYVLLKDLGPEAPVIPKELACGPKP
jgi:hypothetical protein